MKWRGFRSNATGDVWMDPKGRLWYTTDHESLPKRPLDHETVPREFHPPAVVHGEPATERHRFAAVVEAGHAFAEMHVKAQRDSGAGRDSKRFYAMWVDWSTAIQAWEDWDRPAPIEPRDPPFTEREMSLVLTYAVAATGYDGRGLGLWGRGPIQKEVSPRTGEPDQGL